MAFWNTSSVCSERRVHKLRDVPKDSDHEGRVDLPPRSGQRRTSPTSHQGRATPPIQDIRWMVKRLHASEGTTSGKLLPLRYICWTVMLIWFNDMCFSCVCIRSRCFRHYMFLNFRYKQLLIFVLTYAWSKKSDFYVRKVCVRQIWNFLAIKSLDMLCALSKLLFESTIICGSIKL